MTASAPAQPARTTLVVALIALALTAGLVVRLLSDLGWDATAFVGFGEDATPTREYAEEHLGEVFLRTSQGHDGKFFFVQANDPWLTDPVANAELLDFPVHRSRRMLYPLVAGGFGLFAPEATVWGLLAANVAAMAVGTWGTARLAVALGGSPWWGLAFTLNIGLLFALLINSAGIFALAFAVWAVALLYEGHFQLAVASLTAAVLSREVIILCALGVGVWVWTEGRRRHALFTFGVPALLFGLWEIYLRFRLGADTGDRESLGVPFVGLVRSISEWWQEPVTLAFGVCVLALGVLYLLRFWVRRTLLGWAFVGFLPLASLMTAEIWTEFFDFSRVLAPLLTASILLVFVERTGSSNSHRAVKVETARRGRW